MAGMRGQRNPKLGTMSFNPAAVGRKRYNGGTSHAPTVGPVDKTGYIERDQKNAQRKQALSRWLASRKGL